MIILKNGSFDSPYDAVSNVLIADIAKNSNYYGSLIVDIETSVLEREQTIAMFDSDTFTYYFPYDWYEGGDIIIYGYTYPEEVVTAHEIKEEKQNENHQSIQ